MYSLLLYAACIGSYVYSANFQRQPVIIQGHEAPIGKYDYMVQLRVNLQVPTVCGGTLISPTFVFTAAHCVDDLPQGLSIRYVIANNHFNQPNPPRSTVHGIQRIRVHPNWNRESLTYDYALIELRDPVSFDKRVLLSSSGEFDKAGQIVTAHGWGRTDKNVNNSASTVLKEDDYVILSERTCLTKLKKAVIEIDPTIDPNDFTGFQLDPTWICLDSVQGESACNGDSGGPLVAKKDSERPILVGVASFVLRCGVKDYPFFYARVEEARSFIDLYSDDHEWEDGKRFDSSSSNDYPGDSSGKAGIHCFVSWLYVVFFMSTLLL